MVPFKSVFRASKWLHKYVGLLLILYGLLMGVSGILVNHPEWISRCSMPGWLVPAQYQPEGFDRGTLGEVIYSEEDPELAYLSGTEGVWRTTDGGVTFEPMDDGFPGAPAGRVTHDILLETDDSPTLWAGTEAGLYSCDPTDGGWNHMVLGEHNHPVRSVLNVRGELLAFTNSDIWRRGSGGFTRIDSVRRVEASGQGDSVPLFRMLFELHSGAIMGFLGKLLFDFVGLFIVFLCASAFYLWYYPWKRKPGLSDNKGRGLFKTLFKYHLKIGIWIAPIALIMAGTGFFMRPPLLILPAKVNVPADAYPGLAPVERWTERIHRAVHDGPRSRVLVEALDGFWAVPDTDLGAPFEAVDLPIPIHVMGSNVLAPDGDGLLAGSFSGGFQWAGADSVRDLASNETAVDVSTMRLAEHMVTGIITTPDGERFLSRFHGDVLPIAGAELKGRFQMPEAMSDRFRMSLWSGMFELHNGRFFRDWIGQGYLLVPILGSLLFGLILATGVYDWLMVRVIVPRRRSN